MSKSLRLHIFFHILIGATIVIGANRLIAQYMLAEQLTERFRQEMAVAALRCVDDLDDQSRYTLCVAGIDKGSLTAAIADYHERCPASIENAAPQIIDVCRQFRTTTAGWTDGKIGPDKSVYTGEQLIGAERWYAARVGESTEAAMIILRRSDMVAFYKHIWGLRDRNLVYTAPFLLLSLSLVALYLTAVVMRPIKQMEASMSSLNSDNLGQSSKHSVRFIEFRSFVAIYDDLRFRLSASFERARRFAGNASHQLRTPLTIMRGNAEQLIQALPDGSESQIRARIMSDQIDFLNDTVTKLMLLSRADARSLNPQLEVVDLSETLAELVEDWASLQSQISIRAFIEPGLFWRCDKTLLRQLVQNLYDNAVKYNIAVGWIELNLTRRDNQFELTLANPTPALSEDLMDNAFERFYRGKSSSDNLVGGHGLGLSICLEIAKVHHANLRIYSRTGDIFVATMSAPLDPSVSAV